MYSEKSYKNYIFWLQVKRVFIIIVLSCIGAALGILIGKILESTVQFTSYNNTIIIVSTIIFFLISLLLTVGTGRQVQDGYWKIAVLRKLTVIQKNLELNNELLKNKDKNIKSDISQIDNTIKEEETSTEDDEKNEVTAIYKFEETSLVPKKTSSKKKDKKHKVIKTPEGIAK